MTERDSDGSGNAILKRDVKGRVQTGVRQREMLLDEFERSGLSRPKFSEVAGVCYQTFAGWMRKRRRARGADVPSRLSGGGGGAAPVPALVCWVEAETRWPAAADTTAERKPKSGPVVPLTVKPAGGVTVEVSREAQLSLVVELALQLSAHFSKPCSTSRGR